MKGRVYKMLKIFLFSFHILVFVVQVKCHGSLVNPVTRNAVDKYLPWSERAPAQPCICANTTSGSATGPGTSGRMTSWWYGDHVWLLCAGCDNGQACYWYQQGCSIGCPTCDSVSGRVQIDICGLGKVRRYIKVSHERYTGILGSHHQWSQSENREQKGWGWFNLWYLQTQSLEGTWICSNLR